MEPNVTYYVRVCAATETYYGSVRDAILGNYNNPLANSLLSVGNGTSASRNNAFRISTTGNVYAQGNYNTGGADYAENFEWLDGNEAGENRVGLFVTLDGEQIAIANANDDYILGVVSANPAMIGNSDEVWHGKYLRDPFGRLLTQKAEYSVLKKKPVIDENGTETGEYTDAGTGAVYLENRFILNPDYDPSKQFITRADRNEWDAIGMFGVLTVWDDGTCQVNGCCRPADGGIATASESSGYRVIHRVAENIVKIIFR